MNVQTCGQTDGPQDRQTKTQSGKQTVSRAQTERQASATHTHTHTSKDKARQLSAIFTSQMWPSVSVSVHLSPWPCLLPPLSASL